MIRIRPLAFAAGALCLAELVAPAAAQSFVLHEGFSSDPSQRVTFTRVPYSDLDLASPAGARRLLQRIEAAADAVCGGAARAVSAHDRDAYETCREGAISGAVARANSPALAALTSRRATASTAKR
ncbi:MAG TPA: UrcA family protein [Phenylobacterium sp.]|jgi:UrcA family protein|uniref:UrcA family protein n=1 Tax=Phenylobacterium sp. TaxID=1871053 RepID=UPI002CD6269B|nr:UrcA family protein [Phenylobacterium sp.]HXA41165.1 UrcA family protein [Phenylobacterium sp.]